MKIYKILIGLIAIFSSSLAAYAQAGENLDAWYNSEPEGYFKCPELDVIFGYKTLDMLKPYGTQNYLMLVSRISYHDMPEYKTSSVSGFYKGDVVIPPKYNNSPIWGIYHMFGEDEMTSITLPENLRFINGLYYCNQIKELIIPDSVEFVMDIYALDNLEYLQLPNVPINNPDVSTRGGIWSVTDFKKLKSITIPYESLLIDHGFSYCPELRKIDMANTKVFNIRNSSFCNLPELEEIELPYHLKYLEHVGWDLPKLKKVVMPFDSLVDIDYAFLYCPAIEEIWQRCETPYPLGENCFLDTDKEKCVLYVPKGTREAYRNTEGWKEFVNIEEYDLSGVKVATTEEVKMTARGGKGCVKIKAGEGEKVNIYSLDGRCIRTLQVNGEIIEPLARGIYIVASDTARYKIVVE